MPVDHGHPGTSSKYYGTGQSEERIRTARDQRRLKAEFAASENVAYNEGLDQRAEQLRAASFWRGRAVRRVQRAEGA
ncbi:hypothetical protein ACI78V_02050 [Geodermatophilus sp. SYSU D00742]